MELILASASPRRKELLGTLRCPFRVCAADIDESPLPGLSPAENAARVSLKKAMAVPRKPEDVVVAADTVVVCEDRVLGKPKTGEEAAEMLRMLSGRSHQVMTGLTVLRGDRQVSRTEITEVYFRPLTESEILRYIATGEPMDKAGAYGIQGGAGLFVRRIEGDYFNVVGLPICLLGQILRDLAPEITEGIG